MDCLTCQTKLLGPQPGTLGQQYACPHCLRLVFPDPLRMGPAIPATALKVFGAPTMRPNPGKSLSSHPGPTAGLLRLPSVLTLGIDPGKGTGLAVVGPEGVRASTTIRWSGLDDAEAGRRVKRWIRRYARDVRAIYREQLGKTRGEARKWASSWATSYTYGGRVDGATLEALGLYPTLVTPSQWFPQVGITSETSNDQIKALVATLHGGSGGSIHAAEAVAIACGGGR